MTEMASGSASNPSKLLRDLPSDVVRADVIVLEEDSTGVDP